MYKHNESTERSEDEEEEEGLEKGFSLFSSEASLLFYPCLLHFTIDCFLKDLIRYQKEKC